VMWMPRSLSSRSRLRSLVPSRRCWATPQRLRDLEVILNAVVWTSQLIAERDLAAGNAASALARLDSVLPLAEELRQSTDANALDTVAVYWERRGEVLDALNESSQVAECRARAKAIRDRIAALPSAE